MIDQNHQGGIGGWSSKMTVSEIYEELANNKANNIESAVVALDQSAAFEIVAHSILRKTLLHIGIDDHSTNMIMNYLSNRKQRVYVNGHYSDTLLTGDVSVSQGSVMSGVLFLCMTLDLPHITHDQNHGSHDEYYECNMTNIRVFVDDSYGIVKRKTINIWNDIELFIKLVNQYYISNDLVMNIDKTSVMIISHDEVIKSQFITIDNNKIENRRTIKILGTVFNNKLDWSDHFCSGSQSLIPSMKRRCSMIKNIARRLGRKFATQLSNAMVIGKANFHLELIGQTSQRNIDKMDQILINTARHVLGKVAYGRSRRWILAEMGWTDYYTMYESAIQKMCHSLLNTDNNHHFKSIMTKNRSPRILAQNKVSAHRPGFAMKSIEHKTFIFNIVSAYNKLPRQITLITQGNLFRKWLRKYKQNKSIILPEKPYNQNEYYPPIINRDRIRMCQMNDMCNQFNQN